MILSFHSDRKTCDMEQAPCTYPCTASPGAEPYCQDVMIFLNETLVNITVLAQACYCLMRVWKPGKNNAGRWSVISVQLSETKQNRLFLHHVILFRAFRKASSCSLDMQSWNWWKLHLGQRAIKLQGKLLSANAFSPPGPSLRNNNQDKTEDPLFMYLAGPPSVRNWHPHKYWGRALETIRNARERH